MTEAAERSLVDRLAEHRTLGAAPREQLEWLASRGEIRRAEPGEVLSSKGAPVRHLFVLLSGRVAIYADRGAGRHKIVEWLAGDVTGMLPYSRLVSPPGDSVAQEPTEILAVGREHLPGMIVECHELTAILVHVMLDRARHFTSSALHDEKLVSLGKLAAGLAHELNNPASAAERSARLLGERLATFERAARALFGTGLADDALAAIDAVRTACLAPAPAVRSPIEQAAREEEFAGILERHRVDAGLAEALADTGVGTDVVDRLAATLEGPALVAALEWIAAGCAVRALTEDIHRAAGRMSGLVGAVKGFTRLDQITTAEPVDLAEGLTSTLAVLRSKARAKPATVALDLPPDLPRVRGNAGELNQVWANLIDNAIDAVAPSGRVEVTARTGGANVVVVVADDGPGIPPDVRERIFDPFFTTKPVGLGMGLGLDIARRLVRQQDGEIDVDSRPGRTEFRVVLRVAR